MPNFTRFLTDPQFTPFAEVAVSAEKIYLIDPAACVLNCRRSMEFAVKWMYSVDGGLVMPYDDRLVSLMDAEDFRDIVGEDLWRRLKYIRVKGNDAAHSGRKITPEQARLCLENLYIFLDFIAYCYGTDYTEGQFDPTLLEAKPKVAPAPPPVAPEIDLAALMEENRTLKAELTARREAQQPSYTPKPEPSEYQTRKLYIDAMLSDAGWTEGKDWRSEVELPGMPNKSEVGYADYVLYDDAHRPLAVIEAKRTCVDPAKGRQQAKLYADLLEQKYGRRPVIFLTNGFDTRMDDGAYPERKVAAFYSKRDLEKLFNLRAMRTSLKYIQVDKQIAGRYYQEGGHQGGVPGLRREKSPESPAGHGYRFRQDENGHCLGEGAAGARLDQKRPLSGGPQLPDHPGQAQLCESAARPVGHKPVRGEGQLCRPVRVLHLPDHDALHRHRGG